MLTQLEQFILEYPDKPWDFFQLSSSEDVTWEFIKSHPDFNWNWKRLFSNPNITFEIIKNNSDFQWDLGWINNNIEFTIQDVRDTLDILDWSYTDLITHKCITWDIIISNPDIFSEDCKLFFIDNINCTFEIVKSNPEIWDEEDKIDFIYKYACTFEMIKNDLEIWTGEQMELIDENSAELEFITRAESLCTKHISSFKDVKIDHIKYYSDFPWDYHSLSSNPNLIVEFVKENLDKNWDFYHLSKNKCFTMNHVEENPDIPWDYRGLSRNHNLTIPFIEKNISKLSCYDLFQNWRITWKIIKKYYFEERYLRYLTIGHPCVTSEIIKKYPDIIKNRSIEIFENSNFTFNEIKEQFSDNNEIYNLKPFTFQKRTKMEKFIKKRSAEIIHRNCLNWLNKPVTKDGKLGINFRITAKYMYEMDFFPMYYNDIKN